MKSLEELRKIRDEVKRNLDMRAGAYRGRIVVGLGTCGIAAGARETMQAFMAALEEAKIQDVAVTATGCAGFCDREPLVDVEITGKDPVRYGRVDAKSAARIVTEHIKGGQPVRELVFA